MIVYELNLYGGTTEARLTKKEVSFFSFSYFFLKTRHFDWLVAQTERAVPDYGSWQSPIVSLCTIEVKTATKDMKTN